MKKVFILILGLSLWLSGCIKVSDYHCIIYENIDIDEIVKREAVQVIQLVESCIIEGDVEGVSQHQMQHLQADTDALQQFVRNIAELEIQEYCLLGDYYIKYEGDNTKGDLFNASITYKDGKSEMKIAVPIGGEEEFCRITVLKRSGLDYLMIQIYVKELGIWKLASLNLMEYGYGGRTPNDLYMQIQEFQKADEELALIGYCNILDGIINTQTNITYSFMDKYQILKRELETINFEVILEEIDNYLLEELTLVGFEGVGTKEGTVCMFHLVTELPLSDEVAIDEMSIKAAEDLKRYVPDMVEQFDFIAIRVYDEIPVDSNRTYNYYGSVFEVGGE